MKYEIWYMDNNLEEYREFADSWNELLLKINRILASEEFNSVTISKKNKVS